MNIRKIKAILMTNPIMSTGVAKKAAEQLSACLDTDSYTKIIGNFEIALLTTCN